MAKPSFFNSRRSWIVLFVVAICIVFLHLSVAKAQASPHLRVLQVADKQFPNMQVNLAVSDAQGMPIDGLSARNFAMWEDGHPITGFQVKETENTTQPIAVVLAVDTSGSMASSLPEVEKAISGFLQDLQPSDWIAVVTFGDNPRVVQNWTQDKHTALAKLGSLKAAGSTALYDALVKSVRLLQQRGERKVLIVLTDGEDTASQSSLEDALTLAVQSGIPVYPVGFGAVAPSPLEKLAQVTGGAAQIKPTVDKVAGAFHNLTAMLRKEYEIAYVSNLPADGKTHTLEIHAKFQGWELSTQTKFRATPGAVKIELGNLKDGQEVGGTVMIKPVISSPAPHLKQLEIYLDGTSLEVITQPPFGYAWDTSKVKPGTHTLKVVAIDSAQNKGEVEVSLLVRPPIRITWREPEDENAELEGKVALEVGVDAVDPVSEVQFWVDGRQIDSLTGGAQSIYSTTWDTTKFGAGDHVLKVVVKDAKGHQAEKALPVRVALQSRGGIVWLALLVVLAALAVLIPVAMRQRRKQVTGEVPTFAGSQLPVEPSSSPPSGLEGVLVEVSGFQPGREWKLEADEIRLGRSRKDNDLILKGATASRRQALIRKVGGRYVLYNLSPHNPIRVNGKPVPQQHQLANGDVIEAGETTLRFEERNG